MRLQAAETGYMLKYAIVVLDRHGHGVQFSDELRKSAVAMQEWLDLVREVDLVVPVAKQQVLFDNMVRHLLNSESAEVACVPKHHMYAHATHRIGLQGNCRAYSTFIDESLNLVLRTCAQFAHRAHQGFRILQLFCLQGRLGLKEFIFGAVEPD